MNTKNLKIPERFNYGLFGIEADTVRLLRKKEIEIFPSEKEGFFEAKHPLLSEDCEERLLFPERAFIN